MAVYTEFYDWSVDGRLRQLKDRLEAACDDAAADIWANTFHYACIRT